MVNIYMQGILKQLFNLAIKTFKLRQKILLYVVMSICAGHFAYAADQEDESKIWSFRQGEPGEENLCMIYASPYRSRSNVNDERDFYPSLYIVKKGSGLYSLAIHCGSDCYMGASLEIEGRIRWLEYYMGEYAVTYSSIQDVNIINDLLRASYPIKVRTANKKGDVFLDYYPISGIVDNLKKLDGCTEK
jgi:hypothetical protein